MTLMRQLNKLLYAYWG